MKARILVLLPLLMMLSLPLMSTQKLRVAVVGFSASDPASSQLQRVSDRITQALFKSLAEQKGYELLPLADVEQVRRETSFGSHNFTQSAIQTLAERLRAGVVIFGSVSTSESTKLTVEARIFDVAKNIFLDTLSVQNHLEMEDIVIAELIGRVVSETETRILGKEAELVETTLTVKSKDSFSSAASSSSAQTVSNSPASVSQESSPQTPLTRAVTLNAIFHWGRTLPAFGNESETLLGIDFLFDIEQSYHSFGFSLTLIGSNAVDFGLMYETHFFENNYYRNWQIYLRAGPTLTYPLNDERESEVKLETGLGIRFSVPYFVFDAGFGINYYSTQHSSLYIRAGGGFHF